MTVTGHPNLPGGQGNAHVDDVTGSGQKTATGHAESGIDPRIETGLAENESVHVESGSGQKTATDLDVTEHEKRATGTLTAFDALDLLTANGKRSESENDGDVHESYSTVNELSYPSMLLDPKIGNHGRITRGSEPPKSLSIPHVVERAVRNGERQPRKRRGQVESAATERFLTNCSHCAADQSAQMSHVMSMVQIHPLHLVQVGWGSRSKVDRKAPHFLSPTPGQIRNSRDIAK